MSSPRAMADLFAPAAEADWARLARRGKPDGVADLATRTMDGVPIAPIRPAGSGPVLAMRPAGSPWTIVQRIDRGGADDIGEAIAAAIAGGATGVEIVCRTSPAAYGRGVDIDAAMACPPIDPDFAVRIDAGAETPRIVGALARGNVDAAYDPLATLAASGGPDTLADCYPRIARLIAEGHAATAWAADGRPWHNGGATEVQELGIVLASAVDGLRHLADHGRSAREAAGRLGLILSADADQFLTMAKFRAIRLLVARLGEVAGLGIRAPVHAETSWRMLGTREPTMNLVRATTAAFAAATGGADSITVLSPGLDDETFSDRMARNVQTILLEESALCRTADPGAGSGSVEDLTNRLAAAAWELFTRIEGEGGLLAAIRSGSILRTVAASRDARLEAVVRRRMPMVGINVNVDPGAPLPAAAPAAPSSPDRLAATRLAAPIETLAARAGGETIGLLVAGTGSDSGIGDALAALGFTVARLRTPEEAAGNPPRIACMLVGDGGEDEAEAMATALRAAGVRQILGLGSAGLRAGHGLDAIATPGDDLAGLLAGMLDRVADRLENGQV